MNYKSKWSGRALRLLSALVLLAMLFSAAALVSCSDGSPIADEYPYELGDYITVAELNSIKIAASEIEAETEYRVHAFLWGNKLLESVYDAPAALYDKVVMDYVCFIDGMVIDAFCGTAVEAYLGKGDFVYGIEEGIVGMSIGDVRNIDITFPDDYYAGLEGKKAVYRVTLNEISRPKELNDGMCKAYTAFSTVDELYASVRRTVASELAWEQLSESMEVKQYPDSEYSLIYNSLMKIKEYAENNDMTLEAFIKKYGDQFANYGISSDMSEDEFYEACEEYTKAQLEDNMLLHYVLRTLNVPTKGKLYKAMKTRILKENACESAEYYEKLYGVDSFEYSVLYNLALDALYEHVEIV